LTNHRCLAGLLVPLLLLLPQCTRFERARECHALAELINPELESIERLVDARRTPDAAALEQIATRYIALSQKVAQRKPKEPDLAVVVVEYGTTLVRAGALTRSLAVGVRQGDKTHIQREKQELERVTRKERLQIMQLAAHCRA
jgi:hypothetical protein